MRPCLWGVLWLVCASQASFCCLGVFLSSAHLRARIAAFFMGHTLSERCGYSTPHGFAYCESSSERWIGSPAGQYLSSSLLVLCQSSPGTALVSSHTGSPQQSPALCLRLAPSATPQCFPISDARRVYLVDLFIARGPQYNVHTTSLILTLSGHTFSG